MTSDVLYCMTCNVQWSVWHPQLPPQMGPMTFYLMDYHELHCVPWAPLTWGLLSGRWGRSCRCAWWWARSCWRVWSLLASSAWWTWQTRCQPCTPAQKELLSYMYGTVSQDFFCMNPLSEILWACTYVERECVTRFSISIIFMIRTHLGSWYTG